MTTEHQKKNCISAYTQQNSHRVQLIDSVSVETMALAFSPSHPSYFQPSFCKNQDKGCNWESILGYQDKHVRNQCKFEENLNCEFCDSVTPTDKLDAHQNLTPTKDNWQEGCQKARVRCINCEDIIKREQLDEHLNLNRSASPKEWLDGCQNARIKCIHCDEVLERQQFNEHLDRKHAPQHNQAEKNEMIGASEVVTCTLCKRKLGSWKLSVKEKRMDVEPEEKHLALVVIMAWQAHEKWHELGSELGIDSSKLDALRDKHSGSAEACFAEMISIWLKLSALEKSKGELLTYRGFIRALSSPAVGLKNVAHSMEKSKYSQFTTISNSVAILQQF